MNFGQAFEALKQGAKAKRKGWNGKNMFVFLAENIDFSIKADLSCVKELNSDLTLGMM